MRRAVRAIARTTAIIVVVVVIVLAAAIGVFALNRNTSTSTASSTAGTTTTQVSTSSGQTTTSGSSSTTTGMTKMSIDEANNPDSFDPAVASTSNGVEMTMNVNMPLLFYAKGSYSAYIPILSTSWTASPDGMIYTFNLRTNVYYSNGDPFNAYTVWYSLYRVMIMNQGISFVLGGLFNSSGVTAGDLNSFDTSSNVPNSTLASIMENPSNSISVINASAIQFHLSYPFVAFLGTLVGPPYEFVDPYTVEQHGGVVANQQNAWMSVNGSTVGDGPYVEQTFVLNQYSTLIRNPHYWAQNITDNYILMPGTIQQYTLNYKTAELTRALDLETGAVQAAVITFNDVSNVLSSDSKVTIPNIGVSGDTEDVLMNNQKAPLNNVLLREAILDAINLSEIQSSVYEGYIVPFVGPLPSNLPYYNSSILPPVYNVTKAKALLAQAGFPNGAGVPPFTFVYPQSDYVTEVAQIMVQDLSAIGLTLQPVEQSYDTYTSTGTIPGNDSGAPNMYFADFTFYPDFSGYEYLIDANLGFYPYFLNSTINSQIIQSNTQLNSTLRAQEISQIDYEFNVEQAGALWLGQPKDLFEVGGGFGPEVWSSCVSGMWYNQAWMSVDFNALSYTCSPAS